MVQQRKKEMRHDMRRVLASLDKRWQVAAHGEVCARINAVIGSDKGRPITDVLAWVPSFTGEVDLAGVIAEQLRDRRVYLPRILEAGTMVFVRIASDWGAKLEKGEFGVLQPSADQDELLGDEPIGRLGVLVPGMAFDIRGARLGRGGGYYDRFLERLRDTDTLKIGVCWSMQVVPTVPTDPHDVHVDWICHERETLGISSKPE